MTPLPKPSIDTGMGLERVAAVMQGKQSNYDTDLLRPLITRVERLASKRYGADAEHDVSMRVIADHARAATFLITDGVVAVERVARLRAAPDHAAGHAPRPHARARTALPLGRDRDRGRDPGRSVPGDRRGPRTCRRRREAGGGALQRDARPRHGQDPRVPRRARRRPAQHRRREVSLHALRHARLPDRSGPGGLPGRRLVGAAGGHAAVRGRDGGPARARARGRLVRRGRCRGRRHGRDLPPALAQIAKPEFLGYTQLATPARILALVGEGRRLTEAAAGPGCRGHPRPHARLCRVGRPDGRHRRHHGARGAGVHRGHVLPRRPSDRPPRPRQPGEVEGERRGGRVRRVGPAPRASSSTTRGRICFTRRSGGSSAPT